MGIERIDSLDETEGARTDQFIEVRCSAQVIGEPARNVMHQADVLRERGGAKRPAAIYGAKDRARSLIVIFDRQLDLCANSAMIAFHPNQFDIDPVIAVSGICEEPKRVCIPGGGSSHGRQYVFVSSIAQIGERSAVPLVQIRDPGRRADIRKRLALLVSKQHFGEQKPILRPPGSEIDVQEAIVIHVAEIGPHGRVHLVQMHFCRHVFKRSVFHVPE